MGYKKVLLQINVTANWGSTGKIAEQIGLQAMRLGWESYIAHGRMMNPSKSQLIKVGSQWDVYWHYAWSRFFDMEGMASKRSTRHLVREIERIKPDVIHLHNIHDHWLNYPILFEFLSKNDIPVVWTQHDQWATTGHCAYNTIGCERWKTECHDCPVSSRWSIDKCQRSYRSKKKWFTSVKKATIVAVSEWLKSQVEQSFLTKYPIKVIKNGVDINVFRPLKSEVRNKYGFGNRKILLGVAHPWSERKGLKDYIALSNVLPSDCVIVLVGLSEKLQIGLPNNIIGLGVTQNVDELVSLYNVADVVLNLSSAETFGLTTAEGFACGTPGIVYNATASPELITSETGIVVKTGDVNAVADAVKMILSNGKQHYSDACRKRAEECFDKNKCFEEYVKLYENIIAI